MTTHIIVLDTEILRSPDSCAYCGQDAATHIRIADGLLCHPNPHPDGSTYTPLGWSNKAALGLSIGCAWDSRDERTYFFDEHTLESTMRKWVEEQPLIVTFNGISFDLPLLRGILRRRAQALWEQAQAHDDDEGRAWEQQSAALTRLCDAFKLLCAVSYDILAEIWASDPASKRVKGLNGLGSVADANGYGGKTGAGAEAPRLWAAGKYAEVINYCAWDVELTRRLFDQIQRGDPLRRQDGSALLLPKIGGAA